MTASALSVVVGLGALSATTDAHAQARERGRGVPRFVYDGERPSLYTPSRGISQAMIDLPLAVMNECAGKIDELYGGIDWLLWRRSDATSPFWLYGTPRGGGVVASFGAGQFGDHRAEHHALEAPINIFTVPFTQVVESTCHELFHAAFLGTVTVRPPNTIDTLWRGRAGSTSAVPRGLPHWLAEGTASGQIWAFDRQLFAGRRVDFIRFLSTSPQVRGPGYDPGGSVMNIAGVRSYETSLAFEQWPQPRSVRIEEGHSVTSNEYGYKSSSFHMWLGKAIGWEPWFRVATAIGSLDRPSASMEWVRDFSDALRAANTNTPQRRIPRGIGEAFARFITDFAEFYRQVSNNGEGSLFSQLLWLRQMFPSDGCTLYTFYPLGRRAERRIRNPETAEFSTRPEDTSAVGTASFTSVQPLSARCIRVRALDDAGRPMAATFDVDVRRRAQSQRSQSGARLCRDVTIGSRGIQGAVKVDDQTGAHVCSVTASINVQPQTLEEGHTIVFSNSLADTSAPSMLDLDVTITRTGGRVQGLSAMAGTTAANSPRDRAQPARAARIIAPPSTGGDWVPGATVILHDETGPTTCDRRWERYCEPTSQIDIALDVTSAAGLEPRQAVPRSMLVRVPDISDMPLEGLTMPTSAAAMLNLAGGGATAPNNVLSLKMPRIRPGFVGAINNVEASILYQGRIYNAEGPSALRVDDRCNHRFFPTQASVNITFNDGAAIAGTFEAQLFQDPAQQTSCARTRVPYRTIRGSFATGLLGSGWIFQRTHRDMARTLGAYAGADFDLPQAWMFNARQAQTPEPNSPQERAGQRAVGDMLTSAALGGGGFAAQGQLVTCRCDCPEFLQPVLQQRCEPRCAAQYAPMRANPQQCAGQTPEPPPVYQPNTQRSNNPADLERDFEAFLSRLPERSRERIRQQIARQPPEGRAMIMRMVMDMAPGGR